MKKEISFRNIRLENAIRIQGSDHRLEMEIARDGGGILLSCDHFCSFWTLAVEMETLDRDAVPFCICFYKKGNASLDTPDFLGKTGVKPRLRSTWTFAFSLLERSAAPQRTSGRQKLDLSGFPCRIEEMETIYIRFMPHFTPFRVRLSGLRLCDGQPDFYVEPKPLLDEMGQYIPKVWEHKQPSPEKMAASLRIQYANVMRQSPQADGFSIPGWNRFGGWKEKKLQPGSGFFSTCHDEKRWWLTDPEGYAFFSIGPDCVGTDRETRADGQEHLLRYNPAAVGAYPEAVRRETRPDGQQSLFIDFPKINLCRAFGKDWQDAWIQMTLRRMRNWGFNTVANWSDETFCHAAALPYVLPLNTKAPFPSTQKTIYQNFPDVFAPSYRSASEAFARALLPYRNDPLLIGYFMCNEPGWGFEKGLNLGLELLKNPAPLCSRDSLVAFLRTRCRNDIHVLNGRWHTDFADFTDLLSPCPIADAFSSEALSDLRDFTAILIREYVSVPAAACRRADPWHLNLGMRWAFIHDPLLVSGWENFDVFSINCYKIDPLPSLSAIVSAGVDRPLMIGEFHHGALDCGHVATGIRGVASQQERGRAYRYYVENAASFPNLVGCHYFTYNDQSPLGRMDGECYNIGFVDACRCAARCPKPKRKDIACGSFPNPIAFGGKKIPVQVIGFLPVFVYNNTGAYFKHTQNRRPDMVRKANTGDISRLAEIEVFGKRVAYRPIFQDDNGSFNQLQVGNIMDEYRQNPSLLNRIWVYDDGIVKGLVGQKDYPDNHRTDEIELYCFYVEPFFKGQGIGSALLRHFCAEAQKRHKQTIYAWVLQKNTQARRFYERNGFAANGREGVVPGTTARNMCYVKKLGENG